MIVPQTQFHIEMEQQFAIAAKQLVKNGTPYASLLGLLVLAMDDVEEEKKREQLSLKKDLTPPMKSV